MNKKLAAYLAGLIDGEGSIQINAAHPGIKAKWRYWVLTVQISSSATGFLQQLKQDTVLGGSITAWAAKAKGKAKRQAWNWRFYGEDADRILVLCLPYLRLKKPQAEVALRFRRECCHFHANKKKLMPEALLLARRSLAMEMRSLNSVNRKGGVGKGIGSAQYLDVR